MATLARPSAPLSNSSQQQALPQEVEPEPVSSVHEGLENRSRHRECGRHSQHDSPSEVTKAQSASEGGNVSPSGVMVPVHRTFLSDVPEDLRCPICYDGAANCSTRCGHSFCLTCINHHIATKMRLQQSTACPMCRSTEAGKGLLPISKEKQDKVRRQ